MHSSLLLSCGGTRIMIDCGADWLGQLSAISPDSIVITHAHIDHAFGLKDGAPCPVYATAETWQCLDRMPIGLRQIVRPKAHFQIGPVDFEALPLVHSAIAPAVGYRVTVGGASIFYAPDVLRIPGRMDALRGIDLYIGDGARLEHPIRRGEGKRVSGHASIREQLSWCEEANVRHAIFTHCGTPIITADEASTGAALQSLARPLAIEAAFARDGEEILMQSRLRRRAARHSKQR